MDAYLIMRTDISLPVTMHHSDKLTHKMTTQVTKHPSLLVAKDH